MNFTALAQKACASRNASRLAAKVHALRWSKRRVARVPSLNRGSIASWACAMRIARRSRLSLALITPLTAPPTSPHRGEKGVGWPVVLSYEFERPYRKLSEHRQRDRSSDRASQATRPTFDMRLAPLKHWGGVFQVGPSRGPEAKSKCLYKQIADPYEACLTGQDRSARETRRHTVAVFE